MKSKLFISLLIAVVMLVTLAVPVLAGKPYKEALDAHNPEPEETVIANCALQVTHNNDVKVTISLRGATPDYEYFVKLIDHTGIGSQEYLVGRFETNTRGDGRFRGEIRQTFNQPPYTRELQVVVRDEYNNNIRFDYYFGYIIFNS
jgi:hypothetical protein